MRILFACLMALAAPAFADTRTPLYLDNPQSIGNSDDGSGRRALHVLGGGPFGPPPETTAAAIDNSGTLTTVVTFSRGATLLRTTTLTYPDSSKSTLPSSITKVDAL